jgi:hypothetical protein
MLPRGGLFATVIRAHHPDFQSQAAAQTPSWTQWEVPFYPRPTSFGRNGSAQRQQRASALQSKILSIMPAEGKSVVRSQ